MQHSNSDIVEVTWHEEAHRAIAELNGEPLTPPADCVETHKSYSLPTEFEVYEPSCQELDDVHRTIAELSGEQWSSQHNHDKSNATGSSHGEPPSKNIRLEERSITQSGSGTDATAEGSTSGTERTDLNAETQAYRALYILTL